jgi:hypothetical protein
MFYFALCTCVKKVKHKEANKERQRKKEGMKVERR